jgi:hypothetical protein
MLMAGSLPISVFSRGGIPPPLGLKNKPLGVMLKKSNFTFTLLNNACKLGVVESYDFIFKLIELIN